MMIKMSLLIIKVNSETFIVLVKSRGSSTENIKPSSFIIFSCILAD